MKTFYTLLILFIGSATVLNAQIVWDNFQDSRKATYDFENGTFIPYFENPDKSGVNTSLVAAQYTRNPAELFDVIVMDGEMADLGDYLSGTKTMSLDVWSPAVGKTIQITLENSNLALPANFPTGRHSVYLATTSVANAWETLTFSFDNQPDPTVGNNDVNRIVLLFDPNTNNSDTYYWDNFNGPELDNDPCAGVTPDPNILNDFECNQNMNYIFSHSGINFRRVPNPDTNGNTSSFVATYTRNAGEEFDVIIADLGGSVSTPPTSAITMDVWESVGSKPVRISLQDGSGTEIEAIDQTTSSSASAWQTLTFPISATTTSIERVVVLFDPGNFTSDLYYFDNIAITQGSSINDASVVQSLNVYPNPSNGSTAFEFSLEESSDVEISIVSMTGKVVDVISRTNQAPGSHLIMWENESLAEGIYFYNLRAGDGLKSGKIIINK